MHALEILHDLKKCTMTELSNQMDISKQQATPIIDKLAKMGYVIREHDDNDRRIVNIMLAPFRLNLIDNFRKNRFDTIRKKITCS